MSIQEIQQSIDTFYFDWKNKFIQSNFPLKILFGVLKNGKPYISTQFAEKVSKELADVLLKIEKLEKEELSIAEAKFKIRFIEWKKSEPQLIKKLLSEKSFANISPELQDILLMGEFRKIESQNTNNTPGSD